MNILSFDFPFPASLRSRQKTRQAVIEELDRKCRNAFIGPKWEGTVTMTFYGHWRHANGKRKRRDVHNYGVVLIDLLEKRLGFDDSQVVTFVMHKRPTSHDREHVTVVFN